MLDEYDAPLPGINVTIRPPSRQSLTTTTYRDGFAGIWVLLEDPSESRFVHKGEFPVFILTFNLSATLAQTSWPLIHTELNLGAMPNCCVVGSTDGKILFVAEGGRFMGVEMRTRSEGGKVRPCSRHR